MPPGAYRSPIKEKILKKVLHTQNVSFTAERVRVIYEALSGDRRTLWRGCPTSHQTRGWGVGSRGASLLGAGLFSPEHRCKPAQPLECRACPSRLTGNLDGASRTRGVRPAALGLGTGVAHRPQPRGPSAGRRCGKEMRGAGRLLRAVSHCGADRAGHTPCLALTGSDLLSLDELRMATPSGMIGGTSVV